MGNNLSEALKSRFIFSIVLLLATPVFFSCENDMMAVIKLSTKDSIPDVTVSDVHVLQSEMGHPTHELTAPKMISFQTNDSYTEFPNGLKIVFF